MLSDDGDVCCKYRCNALSVCFNWIDLLYGRTKCAVGLIVWDT